MLKFIRKFRILPMLLVAVIVCLVLAHPALAANEGTSLGASMNKLGITAFAAFFSTIIILIALLSIIIAILLGDLMTSFYIFDTGMGDTLHLVWEIMRNFVNVVFIIALLIIAVRVIFGIGDGGGTGFLKKILPKFIIALIAVNLTFFGARFVIGTADVLATAVFALPKSVVGEKMIRGVPCPDTYKEFQTSRVWEAGKCSEEVQKILMSGASGKKVQDKEVSEFGDMLKNVSNATGVNVKIQELVTKENFALVLLMNILRLDDLLWLKTVGGSWQTFLVGGLGSIIMAGAVGVVYFMLFIAFLIRVVILWIMIPLMPLGVLSMVMKDVIPGFEAGGDDTFSLSGFIKTAFMPVFAAFPLSIGMIMIFGNNSISTLDGVSIVSLDALTKHFNVILWWAASIGVIWFGTKKSIEMGNKYAADVTNSIHSKVNGAVGAVAGTAKYLPIIPSFGKDLNGDGKVDHNDMQSLSSLGSQAGLFKHHVENISNKRGQDLATALGYGMDEKDTALQNFIDSKDKISHNNHLKNSNVSGQLTNPNNNSLKAQEARAAVFTKAGITENIPANMSAAQFKQLLSSNDRELRKHYDEDTLKAIRNATETTAAAATRTEVPNAGKDSTTKVFTEGDNRLVINGGVTHSFNDITKGINAGSKDPEVKAVAKQLTDAAALLSDTEKKEWIKLVDGKFATLDTKIKDGLKAALK